LQLAAGHVVDLLRVVAGELVEDVVGGPGALEPQRNGRVLRPGNSRKTQCGGARDGSAGDELAAGLCDVLHGFLSPWWTTWDQLVVTAPARTRGSPAARFPVSGLRLLCNFVLIKP